MVIASEAKQSQWFKKMNSISCVEIAASPSAPRNDVIVTLIFVTKY
jgi:hypothetical protein